MHGGSMLSREEVEEEMM